jgi:hypothetical protein
MTVDRGAPGPGAHHGVERNGGRRDGSPSPRRMIGGMISSAIHVLIMTNQVIFVLMKKHDLKKGKLKYSGMKH